MMSQTTYMVPLDDRMKSIFAEAVEQDFLLKDPTRGIKIPRNLRRKTKQR